MGVQEDLGYNLKTAKSHWKIINSMMTYCGQMKTEGSLAMSWYLIHAGKWRVGFYSWGGSRGRTFQEESMRRGNIQMWEGKTWC